VIKLKVPYQNTEVFYSPTSNVLQRQIAQLRTLNQESFYLDNGNINVYYDQNTLRPTFPPYAPRDNYYFSTIGYGIRVGKSAVYGGDLGSRFVQTFSPPANTGNLQKQISLLRAIPNEQSYLNTAKVISTAQLRTLNNELRYLSTYGIQRQLQQIKSASDVKSTYNIDNFYAQSTVKPTGAPTNARENLYYFNLAPGKRSNKSITQGLTYGQVGSDKPTISTLKAGIPLVKGLTRLEEILSKVTFITQYRKSIINSTVLIPIDDTPVNLGKINASVIVRSTVDVDQVLKEYRFKMSANTVQVLDTPAGTEYITKLKVGGSMQGTGVTDPNPVSRSTLQVPMQFWN